MNFFFNLGDGPTRITLKDELRYYISTLYKLNLDEEYLDFLYKELLRRNKANEPVMEFLAAMPKMVKEYNSKRKTKEKIPFINSALRYCRVHNIQYSSHEEAMDIYSKYREGVDQRRNERLKRFTSEREWKKMYCYYKGEEFEFNSYKQAIEWYAGKFNLKPKGAKSAIYRSLTKNTELATGCLFFRKDDRKSKDGY